MRFLIRLCLLGVALFEVGCANLKEVRDYAGKASQLTAYRELTQRWAETYQRERPYLFDNDLLLARSENDGRKEAVKDLLKIHDTVSLYFAVMGKLAGDDTFSLKVNLDALTRQIKVSELTGLEKKQVEAYGKLAGIVSSTILSGYQQQEIARYIGHGNDPVQAMLAGMRQVLKVYLGTLRNEEGRFGYLLLFKRETPQDRILAALAGAEQARLVERADETRKKLIAVDLAIVKIAQGHQELYNSRHDLGNRELMEQLESLLKELNSLNDLLDTVRG